MKGWIECALAAVLRRIGWCGLCSGFCRCRSLPQRADAARDGLYRFTVMAVDRHGVSRVLSPAAFTVVPPQ